VPLSHAKQNLITNSLYQDNQDPLAAHLDSIRSHLLVRYWLIIEQPFAAKHNQT